MYVTECPYCGQRVRKRAPKLERGAEPDAVPRRRRRSLPRLRRDEIPGIAPETRPYATIAIVVAALGTTLAWVGGVTIFDLGAIVGPIAGDWWRLPAYPFVHTNAGSLFATLVATGLFGMHLERRFGSGAVLAIFLLGATAGGALTVALSVYPAIGANGGALALLTAVVVAAAVASVVPYRLSMRRPGLCQRMNRSRGQASPETSTNRSSGSSSLRVASRVGSGSTVGQCRPGWRHPYPQGPTLRR